MHTFFINDLIQLYILRKVSNKEIFTPWMNCTYSFVLLFMHPYKQSDRCQDMFEVILTSISLFIWMLEKNPKNYMHKSS